MIRKVVLVAALFAITPAFAQQQPPAADPAILQRVLATTQAQRNQLLDALNVSDARIAATAEDLAKAQARIKELEAKPAEPKKD